MAGHRRQGGQLSANFRGTLRVSSARPSRLSVHSGVQRGRGEQTSEAVLYVVAFGLAAAVISMLVQQTAAGTIEGSRVLLASVLTALAGADLTTWVVHHPRHH